LDNIHNNFNKLKDDLFNNTLESRTEENISVNKILSLKNIDENLKEALILLTNNYTAELQAIRHHQVKSLMSIIDNDIAILNKYKEILIAVDNLKKATKKPVLTFKNVLRTLGVVMGMTLFLTVLYHYEPVAVSKAITAVKDFLGFGTMLFKKLI